MQIREFLLQGQVPSSTVPTWALLVTVPVAPWSRERRLCQLFFCSLNKHSVGRG